MQLRLLSRSAAILVAALALGQCAPVAVPATPGTTKNSDSPSELFKRDSINDCGDSTFINQSSGGSPEVADCETLANNIAGGGTWTEWTAPGFQQIAQYGTCAFGVTVGSDNGVWYAYIGNQDIMDLIHSSISLFSWYGLVGAKGEMWCQGSILQSAGDYAKVDWAIFHT